MRKGLYMVTMICGLWGCSPDGGNSSARSSDSASLALSASENNTEETIASEEIPSKEVNTEKINNITYTIKTLSALDFLERKGEEPDEQDVPALMEEMVVLLEIESPAQTTIMESPQLTVSQDQAIEYLMQKIAADITIKQAEKDFAPSGTLYENSPQSNKVRVALFFTGIDQQEPFRFHYYDRLFGAGIVKLMNKS